MNDTKPAITARYHAALMKRSPEERFIMGALMFDTARDMALASIAAQSSPENARIQYFLRFYQKDFSPQSLEKIIAWIGTSPCVMAPKH